jgi:ribonuclease T1
VITPGSSTRGARRIVTGEEVREDCYTSDHYASFKLVNYSC